MWVGIPELQAAIKRLAVQADVATHTVVSKAAAMVEAEAKRNFQGSHKRGGPHVGGDLPNIVTGNLRRSIISAPVAKIGLGEWRTTVGPTMAYGRRVELGYMGSRGYPYFMPAARKVQRLLPAMAAAVWAGFMK